MLVRFGKTSETYTSRRMIDDIPQLAAPSMGRCVHTLITLITMDLLRSSRCWTSIQKNTCTVKFATEIISRDLYYRA
ncbi:uncharacterized protein LOC115232160 isoform X3 [Octopus sinensis]|uniref:Uncharacterized protein LOC115232160 isoform X3 n=1 Tax=Octopus sinensis TaxID=2607531 RepID=A0A7E6FLS9_9MOLL|nr:uncharacterized protein LOC115232160 isoform X3 [Octopus sinensis]